MVLNLNLTSTTLLGPGNLSLQVLNQLYICLLLPLEHRHRPSHTKMMNITQAKSLEFRRKFFKLFGAEVRVTDPNSGEFVGIIRTKAFKLREDIRLFNPDETQEILRIHARQIIDFGATYDVFFSNEASPRLSLQRKGLRSAFARDYWKILDEKGTQYGAIQEQNLTLAILRRWLGGLADLVMLFIPQTYGIYLGEASESAQPIAIITHRKNPFIVKMHLEQLNSSDDDNILGISAIALLSVMDASKG